MGLKADFVGADRHLNPAIWRIATQKGLTMVSDSISWPSWKSSL